MTKKQFITIKLVIVAILAMTVSIAVNLGIAFVPPLAMLVAGALIYYLMRKVDEVMVDERDKALGNQSARVAFSVTALTLSALGASLIALSGQNPDWYRPGYLLLYIVAFLYYQKRGK